MLRQQWNGSMTPLSLRATLHGMPARMRTLEVNSSLEANYSLEAVNSSLEANYSLEAVGGFSEVVNYGDAYLAFDNKLDLSTQFRVAWSVFRPAAADGYISVMLQARTSGWVGLGLMGNGVEHGMVHTDMWWGTVEAGVATVRDAYALSIDAPLTDGEHGHTDDLYDRAGSEADGVTTLSFKRALSSADEWDYAIGEGAMPVVWALNGEGSDDLTRYHGAPRGFASIDFMPARGECAAEDFVVAIAERYAQPDAARRRCYGALPDTTSMPCEHVPPASPAALVVFAVAALGVGCKGATLALLWRRRHEANVKNVQPTLSALLVLGAISLDLTPFLLVGEASPALCALRPTWFVLAFSLMLAPLLVKTWRVWRIFDNPTMRNISDWKSASPRKSDSQRRSDSMRRRRGAGRVERRPDGPAV